MGVDPAVLGKVLAARLADIAAAIDRYDSFAFSERPAPTAADNRLRRPGRARPGTSPWPPCGPPAIRCPTPCSAAWPAATPPSPSSGRATGLPRLAVWERVNGLVAGGLAGRRHEDDSAGLTPAGSTLVELVEGAVAAAGEAAP